jgi:site-specific recombinase XerD
MCNDDRIKRQLIPEFQKRTLGRLRREQLQDFLDQKAAAGLSYSIVAHLRWDLRQIFKMAVAECFIIRNPAELLFIPRECPRPDAPGMNPEQVARLVSCTRVAGIADRQTGGDYWDAPPARISR